MSWTEIDIGELAPGMLGSATVVASLAENHDELYATWRPQVVAGIRTAATETGTTERVRWRFRLRGNLDGLDVRLLAYASGTTSGGTLKLTVGAVSNTAAVNGALTEYTVDVTPAASGTVDCTISTQAAASSTMTVEALLVYLVPVAAGAATAASGFTRASQILSASDAIASEHLQRLLRGPGQVLRDRPHLVLSHMRDVITAPKGSGLDWALASTTSLAVVGELHWPRVCNVPRTYAFDLYLDDTGSDAEAHVQIGTWTWDVTTSGWSSTTATLGPGPHAVSVTCTPGNVSTTAKIAALQAWRLDP